MLHIPLSIDRESTVPLQTQLVAGIRDLIIQGTIRPNIRLPATRDLSDQLRISRNTVKIAYSDLMSQGYLQSKGTGGTYSCSVLPDIGIGQPLGISNSVETRPHRSQLSLSKETLSYPPVRSSTYNFSLSQDDPTIGPERIWRQLLLKHMPYRSRQSANMDPAGLALLREAIASSISPLRGMSVRADRTFIVSDDYRAFDIINRVLLRPGARVAVEDPCDAGLLYLLKLCGVDVVPIAMDAEGIIVENLPPTNISLVYVSPTHQLPMGVTMSLARRHHLLRWATLSGAYILERDTYGEFCYDDSPVRSLFSLDDNDRVIYLNSFATWIGAGINLGYLVVPPPLVNAVYAVRHYITPQAPWLEQRTLAEFISSDSLFGHLRRVRQTFRCRRDALIDALNRYAGPQDLSGQKAGHHLVWSLPSHFPSAVELRSRAAAHDVTFSTLSDAYSVVAADNFRGSPERVLFLGYQSMSEEKIIEGIARLVAAGSPQ